MKTRGIAVLALAAMAWSAPGATADEPKLPDVKTFDRQVIDSLRDIHNKGADLYNEAKDFTGAYRLYQGALETVRPLLDHRPEVQKLISSGLAAAAKETDPSRRAFLLHENIESVRKSLKIAIGQVKPDDKKKEEEKDKKEEEKEEKKEPR